MDLQQEAEKVKELTSRLRYLEQTVAKEEKELKSAEQRLLHTQQAQEVLQHLAQAIQQKAHQKIGEVVSSCLSTIFGEEAYTFSILFERKRGRTEAHLRFTRRDLEVDPLTASGGGVVDVASAALRIACLMLHRPRLSKVIVMDEPFRFVSAEYQDNVRTMLEELAKDLEVQLLMVTHNPALATGNTLEL